MTLAIVFDSVGAGEWLVLLAVLLIVMGPKRLPSTARKIGSYYSKFRRAADSFKRQLMDMDLEMERELRKAEQEVEDSMKVPEMNEEPGAASADVGAAVAATDSSVVTEGGNARFTKIEQKGEYVYLHIDDTIPTVRYQFAAGDAPDALNKDLGQRYGTSGRKMIIVRKAKAGGEFIKMSVGK